MHRVKLADSETVDTYLIAIGKYIEFVPTLNSLFVMEVKTNVFILRQSVAMARKVNFV